MLDSIKSWSLPTIFWSAVLGILLWSAIGFNWFGSGFNWSTSSSSKEMATTAVKERLASICVAQAQADPKVAENLKQLESLSSWKRRKFIEDEKWAVMPGSDSAENGVPGLCAEKLLSS